MESNHAVPPVRPAHPVAAGDAASGEPEGIGSLIAGLVKDLQDLVRAEVQLAKTELKEDVAGAGRGLGFMAGGALIGLVGFIFLMLALTYFLNRWFPAWVSALVVGAVLIVIAAVLFGSGRSQLSTANLMPEQTIATLKEDQAWAKQQINSVKK